MIVLEEAEWTARAAAHADRVDAFVAPHLARRADGVKHPVHDFLFTYYSQRPAQLRRWHPGYGVALGGAAASAYTSMKGYVSVVEDVAQQPSQVPAVHVARAHLESQRELIGSIHTLLTATASRPANTGCFGLHEWAMVYRQPETRHDWPLRLGHAGTDTVVESHRIACSHFDAFRFFTPSAVERNALQPGRDDRAAYEQPGCLHAGMDLYKHAFRLTPLVPSDLVADCFELARDIRELDMRAAPYDLADLGYAPVRIETPEGKQEYAAAQRRFAERGAPLRQRLIDECERLLAEPLPEPMRTGFVVLVLLLAGCQQDSGSSADEPTPTTAGPGTSSTPSPTAVPTPAESTSTPVVRPTRRTDPRWVFFTSDRSRYTSPWFAGGHRVMIPFGCTPAPYYDPDPSCPDGQGSHHGIDIAIPCGTALYAGRPARALSNDALGPAYGVNPVLLRVSGRDVVIGHTRRVFVDEGDQVAAGERVALVGDSAASDGCHLHFEVRPAGAGYLDAVDPRPLLDLTRPS